MNMKKKIAVLAALLFLLTSLGLAQVPVPTKGNVFFGYSYMSADLAFGNRSGLKGWTGSLEGHVLPWVGMVTDVSGYYGATNLRLPITCPVGVPDCNLIRANASVYNFLFGPRVAVRFGRLTPFAHALFGGAHVSETRSGFSDTSFALAMGGGVDYKLVPAVAWRLQGEYLRTRFFNTNQDNLRFSTGIVLRF